MRRTNYLLAAAAMLIGLVAPACSSSPGSSTATTQAATTSATSTTIGASTTTSQAAATTTAPSGSTDLPSLIPAPANNQRTDGPDSMPENGIHEHFLVNGSPAAVMDSYKNALQGKGWSLTAESSGGGGGGGGATYTGTNGGAYGVFTGGGYGNTTDVNVCAWPSKPTNTNCGDDNH